MNGHRFMCNYPQTRDTAEAELPIMTEEQLAGWRRRAGVRILLRHGRYWEETSRGLYQAIHWLARMTRSQARRPTPWCWGYRTTLGDGDSDFANGTMPVNLLTRIDDYHIMALPSKRRNQLRRCRDRVKLVALTGPAILAEQGHAVYCSAMGRLRLATPPTLERYHSAVDRLFREMPKLIIGGIVDGRLGGYLEAYAVNTTAYIHHVYIATEAFPSNIGTGLTYECVQACRRTGVIREIVYGQHSRENASLDVYKEGMGFRVVHLPTRVSLLPGMGALMRWRRPHAHYRMTGRP